jgi:hypothetical protein
MASEQDQDGWNSVTNTFLSEDYSMKTWGDEESAHVEETAEDDPENLDKLAQEYLERRRGIEDPFDYTPWIVALPMPFTKDIYRRMHVH